MTEYEEPFYRAFPAVDGELSLQAWRIDNGFRILLVNQEEVLCRLKIGPQYTADSESLGCLIDVPEDANYDDYVAILGQKLEYRLIELEKRFVSEIWAAWLTEAAFR